LAIFALLLAACGDTGDGNPQLPDGLETQMVAPVDANAYLYLHPPEPVGLVKNAFTGGDVTSTALHVIHQVESMEGIVRDLGVDQALRVTFRLAHNAERGFGDALSVADSAGGDWVSFEDRHLSLGRAGSPWGESLREAWATDNRVPIQEQYQDFWELLKLMPPDPPTRPIAAGFARDVAGLVDQLLASRGTPMPGLTDGLGFLRIGPIAFVGYSEQLGDLPGGASGGMLRDLNAGLIAVTQSGYPGLIVGFTFNNLSGGSGLIEVAIGDSSASYREVSPDFHLTIKTFGSTFFFTAASTREQALALMASVIASQVS
jgi:hypothetical protein